MSDGELRRAHAMFMADPNAFANNPAYMHGLVAEHSRRFSQGNVDADLDAAATTIIPDPLAGPQLGPERKRSRADFAVDLATGGELYTPSENVDAMDVATPPTRRALDEAMGLQPGGSIPFGAMPDADPRTTRAQRLAQSAQWAAGVDRMAEDYNRATGLELRPGRSAPAGPYAEAGRPGYDRTFTPREVLAQRADMESGASGGTPLAFTVPGPRMPDGSVVQPGQPIYDEEAAADYTQRTITPPLRNPSPSKRDIAMRARGMVPVYNPDGSVGYSVEAYPEDDPSTPQNEGLPFPGGVGRAGRREDLIEEGWEVKTVDGPTGKQTVYRPGATAQSRYDDQAEARSRSRIKRSAGISSAEAEGMTTEQLQAAARNKRDDDYNARNATWKAQAMLAGGQPTGGPRGSKATLAAWNALGQEGLNDWQRLTMAKALRPDIDSTSPLTVEANSAKNALRLINADMIGQGGLGDTRAQMMQQKARADAAAYADSQWQSKPARARTTAARERLMRDIDNRFGQGMGVVAAELETNDPEPPKPSSGPPAPPPAPGPMNGLPRFG